MDRRQQKWTMQQYRQREGFRQALVDVGPISFQPSPSFHDSGETGVRWAQNLGMNLISHITMDTSPVGAAYWQGWDLEDPKVQEKVRQMEERGERVPLYTKEDYRRDQEYRKLMTELDRRKEPEDERREEKEEESEAEHKPKEEEEKPPFQSKLFPKKIKKERNRSSSYYDGYGKRPPGKSTAAARYGAQRRKNKPVKLSYSSE